MKIEISDYESPHTLRALAALLTTLADAPTFQKGCAEPCDKPEPLPGRPCSYEPFDIFPNEVAEPDYSSAAGYVPTPPAPAYTGPQSDFTPKPDPAPPPPVTFEGFGAHLPQGPSATAPSTEMLGATDKTGAPWDARIHSSSKALIADGTWRLKRGVDKSLLKAGGAAGVAVVVPPPPFTVNPAPDAAAPAAGAVTFSGVAGAVPSPPLGAAPLPPAAPLPFNEIMRFFAVHSMAGKLTHADMEAMAKHSGVGLTQELINAANAAKRPAALAYLQNLVDSRS